MKNKQFCICIPFLETSNYKCIKFDFTKLLKVTSLFCVLVLIFFFFLFGKRWSAISTHLPGRTDNEIKNFWNTHLKKKLIQMGIDPMTHQPRTDIFASLPQLIALANLRDLVESSTHPLDDHAARLQAEAGQLAKLQYLQFLVQSAASMTNNSYSPNGIIADMEAFNLINSLVPHMKENQVLNSAQFSLGNATSQPLHPPTHIPDPQVPFSFQTSLNSEKTSLNSNEMGHCSNFTMVSQGDNQIDNSSSWLLPSPTLPPTATETSLSNPGDASSTSSYNGAASPYWTELYFEDSIMHEIS